MVELPLLPEMKSRVFLAAAAGLLLASCSSKSVKTTPELSKMEGKKVALVEVDGEATARSIIQVALVNQLVRTGSFELVSKQELDAARQAHDIDPTDWKAVSRRAGADFALRAKVITFSAETHEGYSEEEVNDSQLEAETGNGKTKRVYPVKQLDGKVAVELAFTDLSAQGAPGDTRKGIAEASEQATAEARTAAAHLPPKLRFLEKISNQAFHDFFEKFR